jgi:hypothetical protein
MELVFVKEVDDVLKRALSTIVLAPPEAIPSEARRAHLRERSQKRRAGVKPRAAAVGGGGSGQTR